MKSFLIIISLLFFSSPLWADENNDLHTNLVSLQESVELEIENDVMHVNVSVQHVDKSSSQLAALINRDMQWALSIVKKYKKIKSQTLNYSTYPQYKDRKIKSWSGSQTMSLSSIDFDLLTKVIGKLQQKLQVSNIRFSVSPSEYKKAENSLIADAIKAFTKKAQMISNAMNKKSFDVVTMNVNTNRHYAQPIHRKQRSFALASADAAIPEPGLAAGTNKVLVNISGQIQLK